MSTYWLAPPLSTPSSISSIALDASPSCESLSYYRICTSLDASPVTVMLYLMANSLDIVPSMPYPEVSLFCLLTVTDFYPSTLFLLRKAFSASFCLCYLSLAVLINLFYFMDSLRDFCRNSIVWVLSRPSFFYLDTSLFYFSRMLSNSKASFLNHAIWVCKLVILESFMSAPFASFLFCFKN